MLAFEAANDAVGVLASMPVLAAEDIAAGRLVMPFSLQVPLSGGYYMAVNEHTGTRPAVAAFCSWLKDEAARMTAAEPELKP